MLKKFYLILIYLALEISPAVCQYIDTIEYRYPVLDQIRTVYRYRMADTTKIRRVFSKKIVKANLKGQIREIEEKDIYGRDSITYRFDNGFKTYEKKTIPANKNMFLRTSWYEPAGEVRSVTIKNYEEGKSIVLNFSKNGNLLSFSSYKNGHSHGNSVGFYDDGSLKWYGEFDKGSGKNVTYYKSGQIKRVSTAVNDCLVEAKHYDDSGHMYLRVTINAKGEANFEEFPKNPR